MGNWEEKFERTYETGDRAMATLKQLLKRRGVVVNGDVVTIQSMERVETWRRVSATMWCLDAP